MAERGVEIRGLSDFRSDLRVLSEALPVELREFAGDTVERMEASARERYSAYYPRPDSTRPSTEATVNSIEAVTSGPSPSLSIDDSIAPHAVGQEVGSTRYAQFAPWTGPSPDGEGSAGRFFAPAIREETDEIEERMWAAIAPTVERAFPSEGVAGRA